MASSKPPDFVQVKLVLVGDSSVGKTHLLLRYADEKEYKRMNTALGPTINVDEKKCALMVDSQIVELSIWDTPGQGKLHKSIPPMIYRRTNGVIIVYDITNRKSFDGLAAWVSTFETLKEIPSDAMLAIIGTKLDQEDLREVLAEEGRAFASSHRAMFFETSSKTAEGVRPAFEDIVRWILGNSAFQAAVNSRAGRDEILNLGSASDEKKSGGCCS